MLSRGARVWFGAAVVTVAAACSTFASEESEPVLPERDSSASVDGETGLDAGGDAATADAADAAPDPVIDLQAGENVGCALKESGRVTCWGNNGSLGTGQLLDLACEQGTRCRAPTEVPGLKDIVQISVGHGFACARRKDGAVLCWGENVYGTLGTNSTSAPRADVAVVAGLPPAIEVVAGYQTACARVTEDGGVGVYCWGSNEQKLLAKPGGGINGPTRLELDDAKAVRLGVAAPVACAIRADARVVCWGRNASGCLGHFTSGIDTACPGSANCNQTPMLVGGTTFLAQDLEVGYFFACARLVSGGVQCWGNNEYGALGRGPPTDANERPNPSPVDSAFVTNATAISARGLHACALVAGTPYCWGHNHWGELGDGAGGSACSGRLCRSLPVAIGGLGPLAQLSTGTLLTLARATDGGLHAWGANYDGRLGHAPGTGSDLFCTAGTNRCSSKPGPLVIP